MLNGRTELLITLSCCENTPSKITRLVNQFIYFVYNEKCKVTREGRCVLSVCYSGALKAFPRFNRL
jgi:hypothetical protein